MSDPDIYRRLDALERWRDDMSSVEKPLTESGVFTPTFGGSLTNGTFTYAQQSGIYRRIGDLALINIVLQAATMGVAPTGDLRINGLPFSPVAATGLAKGYQNAATIETAIIPIGQTYVEFYTSGGVIVGAASASASLYLILSGSIVV